jgi:hypothetical protein
MERAPAWSAPGRSELPGTEGRSEEEWTTMSDALIAPASSNRMGGAPGAPERYSYDRGDFTWLVENTFGGEEAARYVIALVTRKAY